MSDAEAVWSRRRWLLSGASLLLVKSAVAGAEERAPVRAKSGEYLGEPADGVMVFRGVRYAQDTALVRFKPPIPAGKTSSLVRAWKNAPICPQRTATKDAQSEDCLFLNIWTPAADHRAKLPVMVYVHGGAYSTGSGNDPLTDGAKLAKIGGVVVVCVTHRINAFGYLYLARLDAAFQDSGNVGQLDLILALKWVQENIGAFGGDGHNVTLFGQSGGGAKIATLMAMPGAQNLFHKAATMSGQQVTASGPQNATKRAQAYLSRLGKAPETAATSAIVEALAVADPIMAGAVYFGPVLDGRHLLRHPFYPDAPPQSHHVPMMLGNTVAETRTFFPPNHEKMRGLNWANIADRVATELRVDISPEAVIDAYRGWFPESTPAEIFIAATTASRSWRGQVIEAEARCRANAPTYVYQLDFENAAHTDDIGLVFGTSAGLSADRAAVSAHIMSAFLDFAKTGAPGWSRYDLVDRPTMVFDRQSRVVKNPRGRERELFATVPYLQPGS